MNYFINRRSGIFLIAFFIILQSCRTFDDQGIGQTPLSPLEAAWGTKASPVGDAFFDIQANRNELLYLAQELKIDKILDRTNNIRIRIDREQWQISLEGHYPTLGVGWILFWDREWSKKKGLWVHETGIALLQKNSETITLLSSGDTQITPLEHTWKEHIPSGAQWGRDTWMLNYNLMVENNPLSGIPMMDRIVSMGASGQSLSLVETHRVWIQFDSPKTASAGRTLLKLTAPALLSNFNFVKVSRERLKFTADESFVMIEGLGIDFFQLFNTYLLQP